MASKSAARIETGTTKVTTAQTAAQLTYTVSTNAQSSCLGVLVQADANNTGKCAVGDKNVNAKATLGTFKGHLLEKGQVAPIFIETADPSTLWFDAEKSGDYVCWTILWA